MTTKSRLDDDNGKSDTDEHDECEPDGSGRLGQHKDTKTKHLPHTWYPEINEHGNSDEVTANTDDEASLSSRESRAQLVVETLQATPAVPTHAQAHDSGIHDRSNPSELHARCAARPGLNASWIRFQQRSNAGRRAGAERTLPYACTRGPQHVRDGIQWHRSMPLLHHQCTPNRGQGTQKRRAPSPPRPRTGARQGRQTCRERRPRTPPPS